MQDRRDRVFILLMLAPIFFFLFFFYGYPTLFNLYNSFTDLNLMGLKAGGSFIGLDTTRASLQPRFLPCALEYPCSG